MITKPISEITSVISKCLYCAYILAAHYFYHHFKLSIRSNASIGCISTYDIKNTVSKNAVPYMAFINGFIDTTYNFFIAFEPFEIFLNYY